MIKRVASTLVLLFVFTNNAYAFDDLQSRFNLDVLYHYSRIERTTLFNTDSFLSRQGAMLQFEYEDHLDLFWRWYIGGDLTWAQYEAAANTTFNPHQQLPWQLYIGNGFQFGTLKNFEMFFGLGGSSEHFFIATANGYNFYQKMSARAHIGMSWRFLSVVGSSATLLFRYSRPVTPVNHNGVDLDYAGILDANLRLRGQYDSGLSLYGGIRFEDYKTSNQSISYFTSRLYAGVGLHF
jgi:hypothetical protein